MCCEDEGSGDENKTGKRKVDANANNVSILNGKLSAGQCIYIM